MQSRMHRCPEASAVQAEVHSGDLRIFILRTDVGLHTGFVSADADAPWYLHMGLEGLMTNSMPGRNPRWLVAPNIEPLRLRPVLNRCRLIRRRAHVDLQFADAVPYSFDASARIVEDPSVGSVRVEVEGDGGFTCATFVLAVFESVGLRILDIATVVDDPVQTQANRHSLIAFLRAHGPVNGALLERLERTIGQPRIAPECVAGAMLDRPHPMPYARALELAQHVLQQMGPAMVATVRDPASTVASPS